MRVSTTRLLEEKKITIDKTERLKVHLSLNVFNKIVVFINTRDWSYAEYMLKINKNGVWIHS